MLYTIDCEKNQTLLKQSEDIVKLSIEIIFYIYANLCKSYQLFQKLVATRLLNTLYYLYIIIINSSLYKASVVSSIKKGFSSRIKSKGFRINNFFVVVLIIR